MRPVLFATVRSGARGEGPLIGDEMTARCADLFNVGYEILLQTFERYFAHTEETDAQLATLAEAAFALMLRVLRPLGSAITTLPVGPEHPGMTAGPSFELFYETDYLMPHREAAWALLEERLRDAVAFCRRLQGDAGEPLATTLGPIGDALGEIADSLAAHFGEWGAVSRFGQPEERTPRPPPDQAAVAKVEQPGPDEPISFDKQIKPLFRDRDQRSMKFAFDLWSYDDVKANGQAILERLDNGTMPCDGAWPPEQITAFKRWLQSGMSPDTERTAPNETPPNHQPCRSYLVGSLPRISYSGPTARRRRPLSRVPRMVERAMPGRSLDSGPGDCARRLTSGAGGVLALGRPFEQRRGRGREDVIGVRWVEVDRAVDLEHISAPGFVAGDVDAGEVEAERSDRLERERTRRWRRIHASADGAQGDVRPPFARSGAALHGADDAAPGDDDAEVAARWFDE